MGKDVENKIIIYWKEPYTTQLNKLQTEFIWKNGNPGTKQSTLLINYKDGRLKNVDIFSKKTVL